MTIKLRDDRDTEMLISATVQFADALRRVGMNNFPQVLINNFDDWMAVLHAAPSWSISEHGSVMIEGIEYRRRL